MYIACCHIKTNGERCQSPAPRGHARPDTGDIEPVRSITRITDADELAPTREICGEGDCRRCKRADESSDDEDEDGEDGKTAKTTVKL